jgi:squalene-hopene/tetraprenyl-beta-curcumene cyclase
MNRWKHAVVPAVAACLALLVIVPVGAEQTASATALSAATRAKILASMKTGVDYLKQQQDAAGLWSQNYGVSGVAAIALLNAPTLPRAEAMKIVTPTLDAFIKIAKPDGGMYESMIPYYITAVGVSALAAGGRPADQKYIKAGAAYLQLNMLDEGEGIAKTDFWYGGMGYGGATRPDRKADIISLEYALRAMHDAEVPANDAAWQKALTFLQRTQNNSETNDQAWAANDGGFVYFPGFSYNPEGPTRSYGSVSYAGVLSYTWANLKKTDPRVQAVVKWVRDNYNVDENPGMGQKTVYYYYMVMAKALAAVGEPTFTDAKGRRHNWREELGAKLIALQHSEGFWVNPQKDEMQDDPRLVTAFVLTAFEAILK